MRDGKSRATRTAAPTAGSLAEAIDAVTVKRVCRITMSADERTKDVRVALVARYLGLDGHPGRTGRLFDALDGGGPTRSISAADLVAVTALSMEIREETTSGIDPRAAAEIEDRSERWGELLGALPPDIDLHDVDDRTFDALLAWETEPPSVGCTLWKELHYILSRHTASVGPAASRRRGHYVATSKLMHRKRPRLFPILDNRVVHAVPTRSTWTSWWKELRQSPGLVDDLRLIREKSGAGVSLLRIADIVIWMAWDR